jgi:hypothetical protein
MCAFCSALFDERIIHKDTDIRVEGEMNTRDFQCRLSAWAICIWMEEEVKKIIRCCRK